MLGILMNTNLQLAIGEVLNLQELAPNEHVNRVMSQLVNSVISTKDLSALTLKPALYNQIRNISAEAETEMEKFWARLIITSANPYSTLLTFPYLDNYTELTKRELGLVASSGLPIDKSHKVLVIGSGPLPLSAYELHYQSGASIDHVDSSAEAIKLCKQTSQALGIDSQYFEAYGHEVLLHKQYDLILIAALAGSTAQDKQQILNNILPHLSDQGRIIVRSARGSRELLYPAIAASDLTGVRLLEEYHPSDYIINSVFVYGK